MMKHELTMKEVCQQSFDVLVKKGYSPRYLDGDKLDFVCEINGVRFSFYPIEDDVFGFSAEFELDEVHVGEKEKLEYIFLQTEPDDVAFENFHMGGIFVVLSSAFTCDMYDDEMIEMCIKTLEGEGGIVSELKLRQIG